MLKRTGLWFEQAQSARFRWFVSLSIILLLVWLLLASLKQTITEAEQQLVEEYRQLWNARLGQFHGLWLARFRPKQLKLNLYRQVPAEQADSPGESFSVTMNDAGWPQADSTEQCLQLWRQIVGTDLSVETQASVQYQPQRCYYWLPFGEIVYDANQGMVSSRWSEGE